VQKTAGALQGGTALRLVSNTHPPRRYGQGIPGNQPTPAWLMLSALSGEAAFGSSADILQWLAREVPGFENLKAADPPTGEDLLWDSAGRAEMGRHSLDVTSESPLSPPDSGGSLHLLSTERTFGSEELSCRSPQLIELESTPQARLAPSEARRLALNDGDRVALAAENGFYETTLKVADNMAEGTLVVGRHCHPDWPWDGRHARIAGQSIKKIEQRETKFNP
jgi:NADH-quinone oxidoreductase subunit G